MENLSNEDVKWLKELRDGGLLRQKLPQDIEERFLAQGWAEQKLGGVVISSKGRQALLKS